MKKVRLLALVTAGLMLLSGCNVVDVTKVLTIGDTVVYKAEYNYYLAIAKSQAAQQLQNQGQSIEKDEDWNTLKIGDKTAAEFVKEKAYELSKQVAALVAKGKKDGFVLDAAGQESITTTKQQLIENAGGVYAYEDFFKKMGVSTSDLNNIVERSVYAESYKTAHPELTEVSDDEIMAVFNKDYNFYVKHILIKNTQDQAAPGQSPEAQQVPGASGAPEAVSPVPEVAPAPEGEKPYDEVAKEKAQNILEQIKKGADFTKLMHENSEDKNEAGELNAEGYFITEDSSFDPAFAEAAKKLKVGEYTTELVQSTYGYHIIMRFDPPKEGTDFENAKTACKTKAQDNKLKDVIDKIAKDFGFEENDKFLKRVKVTV